MDMGGRGSKTKPNASTAPPQSRRALSFRTDAVVSLVPMTECVDEMRSNGDGHSSDSEDDGSAAKVSKVQAILEGKIELRKHQQTLEHLPPTATNMAVLELQFSSSEDSDEGTNRKKRKGSKKKVRKRRSTSERAAPSPSPSPVKLKLNELKLLKKAMAQQQPQSQEPELAHFEQIKDAYALAEYSSKDTADDPQTYPHQYQPPLQRQQSHPSPQPPPRQDQQKQQQQYSPSNSKQQPSPAGSSPGKLFANALDNWRRASTSSTRSVRSQIMDPRDPSRSSPPKSSNHSTPSTKSHSSREGDHAPGSSRSQQPSRRGNNGLDLDLDAMDAEDSFSIPAVRNRVIELKIVEARQPVGADLYSKRYRTTGTGKRNLRIDDSDESIMDDILAEVVT